MNRARLVALGVGAVAAAALVLSATMAPPTQSAYIARVANSTNTAATAQNFTCAGAVATDRANALFAYALNEASNSTSAADASGNAAPGTYRGSMTTSATTPIACSRDTAGAYVLDGSTSYVTAPTLVNSPATFSLEVWFKSTVASGKLIGFGNALTGSSGQYDRHIYFSTTGQLIFGIYNGGTKVITSPSSYNDGSWHQVVATFSATTGMILYVDGTQVATDPTTTLAEAHTGYWRIGYDNQSGWPSIGANNFFKGSMRFAAVYTSVLSATQVANHYAAGR